jgi:hypothetical protein
MGKGTSVAHLRDGWSSPKPREQSCVSRIPERLTSGIRSRRKIEPEDGEHLGHPDDADVFEQPVLEARHGGLRQADRAADVCQAQTAVQPGGPSLADEVREN